MCKSFLLTLVSGTIMSLLEIPNNTVNVFKLIIQQVIIWCKIQTGRQNPFKQLLKAKGNISKGLGFANLRRTQTVST